MPPALSRRSALALSLSAGAALSACGSSGSSPESGGNDSPAASGADATKSGSGNPSGSGSASEPQTSAPGSPDRRAKLEEFADSLSPRDAAAQHVFTAIPQGTSPWLDETVGGYFLLSTWRSESEVLSALDAVRTADFPVPPMTSVDQEGGQVRMIRTDGFPATPSAKKLGAQGPDAVRDAYGELGEALKKIGIHVALAPVADTVDPNLGSDNAPVGQLRRGFGTDPATVSDCVAAAVEALTETGVASSLKHFPGLGRIRKNTDHSASGISDSTTERDDAFFAPFEAGIRAGAGVVMMSSATYPNIDPENPAMFSRTAVTDVLRGSLGFDRVIMTDDVGAAQSVQRISPENRVKRFLSAGGDIAITADPSLTRRMIDAAEEWAGANPTEARASLLRILALKADCELI